MELSQYVDLNKQQFVSEIDTFTEKRYAQFYKYFGKEDRRVLDIGCNTGRGGMILRQLEPALRVTGLDIIEDRIRRIPEGLYERLILSPADSIDVPDNFFDAVVAGEVIEHIHPNDADAVLKEINRTLRPGGKILLTTPNPRAILVLMGRDDVLKDPSHIGLMMPAQLKEKLIRCGFEKVRFKGSGKMTKYLPDNFPLFSVFGSYLAIATKPASGNGK
ncbi:MAG TPA: methyltransferase domain-containing protein [Puia sp.]|nr:methyltransferase domain-containing protein [Puia sp.]